MNFESYAARIMELREYDASDRAPKKTYPKTISSKKYSYADGFDKKGSVCWT